MIFFVFKTTCRYFNTIKLNMPKINVAHLIFLS